MSDLQSWFLGLLPMLGFLAVVVLLDTIGGALIAWKKGEFSWEELPAFLQPFVLHLFAWIAMELLAFLPGFLEIEIPGYAEVILANAGLATYAFIILKYVASILAHIQEIKELPAKSGKADLGLGRD